MIFILIRTLEEYEVRTRPAAGTPNLLRPHFNTEMRANFFSVRVIDR
jgi:hypothetical protein